MASLTQEQVKELFEYKEGNLYWKKNSGRFDQVGSKAGITIQGNQKYVRIWANGRNYRAHSLIFLYECDAAEAYDTASVLHFKDFARNNKGR